MRTRRTNAALVGVILSGVFCNACQEKVVAVRGGLQNMPGARGGVRVEASEETAPGKNYERLLSKYNTYDDELVPDENHPLRLVDPHDPERVTLVMHSPQHVVIHLHETLQNGELDLLYDQVLSDRLKRNYRELLKDPHEAVDYLVKNEKAVRRLIATMPAADQTPGLSLRPLGDNMYRIQAPGNGSLDMKFQKLDLVLEDGQFRLLLIH
jgi:hypothetical protein